MAKLNLTPQQSAAVENRGGSLLVSAAAGSGKTKVLVERLFRYITAEHCHVDDFLIITYTKAAAAELRSKISEELSRRLAETPGDRHLRSQLLRVYQADIKTVDAFCTALLRENTHLLAQDGEKHTLTPDFRVLDENDAALLRKRVLGRVLEAFYENMDAGAALLADTLGAGRDDSALENLVLETYEKLQSHASPEAWLERNRTAWTACTGDFDETPYADALLRQVRRKVHHWSQSLLKAASALALDPQKDDLYRGYGEKFIAAAESIAELETSNGWEETRQCLAAVTFPRLTTPKGMKDDAEVLRLKKLWEGGETLNVTLDLAALYNAGKITKDDLGKTPIVVSYTAKVVDDAINGDLLRNDAYVRSLEGSSSISTVIGTVVDTPHTGGPGTMIFTVAGMALLGGAAGLMVLRRRKEDAEN